MNTRKVSNATQIASLKRKTAYKPIISKDLYI